MIDSIQRQVAQMFQASVAASAAEPAAGPGAQPPAAVPAERPAPERAGQDALFSAAVLTFIPLDSAARRGSAPVSPASGKDEPSGDAAKDEESRSDAPLADDASEAFPAASPDAGRAARAYAASSSRSSSSGDFRLTV